MLKVASSAAHLWLIPNSYRLSRTHEKKIHCTELMKKMHSVQNTWKYCTLYRTHEKNAHCTEPMKKMHTVQNPKRMYTNYTDHMERMYTMQNPWKECTLYRTPGKNVHCTEPMKRTRQLPTPFALSSYLRNASTILFFKDKIKYRYSIGL